MVRKIFNFRSHFPEITLPFDCQPKLEMRKIISGHVTTQHRVTPHGHAKGWKVVKIFRAIKMELVFAKFAFLLYFLNTVTASVDITLEDDDLIHSPFSEHAGSDVHSYTVFTKEELSKYNGEDVSAAVNCVDVAF